MVMVGDSSGGGSGGWWGFVIGSCFWIWVL